MKNKSKLRKFSQYIIKHKVSHILSAFIAMISVIVIEDEWGMGISFFKSPYIYIWMIIIWILILIQTCYNGKWRKNTALSMAE